MIIAVAFVLIAALLLWLLIGSRGHWGLKLALIAVVIPFMILTWIGVQSYGGWPTSNDPPKAAYFVYGYAIEPDPENQVKGVIYVWLIPPKKGTSVLKYNAHPGEPRAYKLPYSPDLARQIAGANQAAHEGKQVVLAKSKSTNGKGKPRPGGVANRGHWQAYVLPPVSPPTKS